MQMHASDDRAAMLQELYEASLEKTLRNHSAFSVFLSELETNSAYDEHILRQHLQDWGVGTDVMGNCVFWYRDETQALCTAKTIPFDPISGQQLVGNSSPMYTVDSAGERHYLDHLTGVIACPIKEGEITEDSFISMEGFRSCLFGAHRIGLTHSDTPVLLFENERAAVIASIFLPVDVVALGKQDSLTFDNVSILAGRDVFILLGTDEYGDRQTEDAYTLLRLVGARPVVSVDGQSLRDYLMPDIPVHFDIADYYVSILHELNSIDRTIMDESVDLYFPKRCEDDSKTNHINAAMGEQEEILLAKVRQLQQLYADKRNQMLAVEQRLVRILPKRPDTSEEDAWRYANEVNNSRVGARDDYDVDFDAAGLSEMAEVLGFLDQSEIPTLDISGYQIEVIHKPNSDHGPS